jgi:cellulose synthase/poly-beta-1,6-N-acetylglucosamine synthase-like glycosyltransferase
MSISLLHTALVLVGIATFYYLRYWHNVATHYLTDSKPHPVAQPEGIALLCVLRNEEAHLPKFLQNLQTLIASHPIPIFLIDDHSFDTSVNCIKQHPIFSNHSFNLYQAPPGISGKKQCIQWAIDHHIPQKTLFTTDADCLPQAHSILALWHEHIENKADLSLGLMTFSGGNTPLHLYQKIENTALVALATYHASQKHFSMGNAANMMFERQSFLEIQPYQNFLQIAGGDDIFLIKAMEKHQKTICYSNSPNTLTHTHTLNSWRALWHQRLRWAKKSQFQSWGYTQFSQILLVLYFICFWGMTLALGYHQEYVFMVTMWAIKFFGEVHFIRILFHKIPGENPPTWIQIACASIIQMVFIPLVALFQFFSPVYWKNRRI